MNDTIKNGTTDKPPVSAIIEACRLHYGDRHKRVFDVVEQFLVDICATTGARRFSRNMRARRTQSG